MREIKVGAIALALIALAVGLLVAFENTHLRPGIRIQITMARTGALKEKAPVRIAGLELGRIERIELRASPGDPEEPTSAVLHVWIQRRHAWLVREDSIFFVNQVGLLGEAYIEVGAVPGKAPGRPLDDGAVVEGIAPPRIDRVLANSTRNLEAATSLIRDGMPEVKQLGRSLTELDENLAALSPSPGDALRAWTALRALAREADALADGLESGSIADGRVPGVQSQWAASASLLVPRLRALSDAADRLAPLQLTEAFEAIDDARAIYARAQQTMASAGVLAAYVTGAKGTLGALLQDAELNDDLKAMSKRLKRTPWESAGHPSMKKAPP
jgi:phospholipid/cholesterol/gamma-HCH transport system substrate-binding protein